MKTETTQKSLLQNISGYFAKVAAAYFAILPIGVYFFWPYGVEVTRRVLAVPSPEILLESAWMFSLAISVGLVSVGLLFPLLLGIYLGGILFTVEWICTKVLRLPGYRKSQET